MSSTYLTSDNTNLIERLLSEVRGAGPTRNFDRETAEARFLKRIEQRTTNEDNCVMPSRIMWVHKIMDSALPRLGGEGGAKGIAP